MSLDFLEVFEYLINDSVMMKIVSYGISFVPNMYLMNLIWKSAQKPGVTIDIIEGPDKGSSSICEKACAFAMPWPDLHFPTSAKLKFDFPESFMNVSSAQFATGYSVSSCNDTVVLDMV